jgi:hypothetical protein
MTPQRSSRASMNTLSAGYTEALEQALGQVIRDAARQVELHRAESAAIIADLRARVVEGEVKIAALQAAAEAALQARFDERCVAAERRAAESFARMAEVARAIAVEEVAKVEVPPAPDLSGYALRGDLDALSERVGALPVPTDPDLSGLATKADTDALRALIQPAVDMSGFATRADVEAVRQEILPAPDLSRLATKEEVEAVRSSIPVPVAMPDLSGFATSADLDAVRREIPVLPELKDWLPQIEDAAASAREAAAASIADLRQRMERHPGRFPIARVWEDGVHYSGDLVTHAGALWQAKRDTGREPPHDDWACLAERGERGQAGVSIRWRGTYDPAARYAALDIVALDGSSFGAKIDDPGPCPGEGWQLVAGRGGRGKQGESIKGPPGPALVAAVPNDDGVVVFTNSDGSTVELDLAPLLARYG